MSLVQNGFNFFGHPHSPPVPETPYDPFLVVDQFAGVEGESHIVGPPFGRYISCRLTLEDYASLSQLEVARDTIDDQVGTLTGTLAATFVDGSTRNFLACTFLGIQPEGEPFFDGSGVHGWCQFGRLVWRKRIRQ